MRASVAGILNLAVAGPRKQPPDVLWSGSTAPTTSTRGADRSGRLSPEGDVSRLPVDLDDAVSSGDPPRPALNVPRVAILVAPPRAVDVRAWGQAARNRLAQFVE